MGDVTAGTGGGICLETCWADEAWDADEARVDVDEEREKVRLGLDEMVRPESRDI
jgi:hypothetical protein